MTLLPADTVEHRPFCAAPVVTLMRYRSGSRAVCRDCGASVDHVDDQRGTCGDCGGLTAGRSFTRCRDCHYAHRARVQAQAEQARAIQGARAQLEAQRAQELRARSGWRCRDHPDEPVRRTPRGYAKGCRRCTRPQPTQPKEIDA